MSVFLLSNSECLDSISFDFVFSLFWSSLDFFAANNSLAFVWLTFADLKVFLTCSKTSIGSFLSIFSCVYYCNYNFSAFSLFLLWSFYNWSYTEKHDDYDLLIFLIVLSAAFLFDSEPYSFKNDLRISSSNLKLA